MEGNNQAAPHCPFCRSNGMLKGTITAETKMAYLIEAAFSKGYYLIIPTSHVESVLELPDLWWRDIKTLLPKILPEGKDYNLSFNIGNAAGQTIKHLHLWVIPREAGQPSSGKGLASLITEANTRPK